MKKENALKAIEIIDEAITKLTALRDAEKAKIKKESDPTQSKIDEIIKHLFSESTETKTVSLHELIESIKAKTESEISLEDLKKFPHIQSAMKEETFKLMPDKYKEAALRGYHEFFMKFNFLAN